MANLQSKNPQNCILLTVKGAAETISLISTSQLSEIARQVRNL
jgi:hypothetical protein